MTVPAPPRLSGRTGELDAMRTLIANVRGESAVLVARGGSGIGKTAPLRHQAEQASGFKVARTVEWHLRKVFAKPDISSGRELDEALRRRG